MAYKKDYKMKKILLTAVAVGIMVTSGMAGTVSKIVAKSDGVIRVGIIKNETEYVKPLSGTSDANKAMLAVSLTALSSGADVESTQDSGAWSSITILKQP